MVEHLLRLLEKEISGLHQAAYLLGAFAILSQALALVRDRLLASNFGAHGELDVYYAAFRIPDIIFAAIASLVSVYALIPFASAKLSAGEKELRRFLGEVASFFFILIGACSLVAFFLAPKLLPLLFGDLHGAGGDDLLLLSRILLLQPIFLGFSGLLATITQLRERFILYALSPLLYNLGIIFGIVFFYPTMGLSGLAWGVVLGAVLHAAIQVPAVVRAGLLPILTFSLHKKELWRVVFLSLPRTLALSVNQLAILAITVLAGTITSGAIAVFNFAYNLQAVPLAIIGVSYSVAAFPTLARLFGEGQREAFFAQVIAAARHIIFWTLPTLALIIVLRAHIVRVILGSGEFDWSATRLTAAALALFIVSLLAQSIVLLLVRGYYAAGKTRAPLIINLLSALGAVLGAWTLLTLFQSSPAFAHTIETLLRVEGIPGTALLMLPLGYAIAQILNAAILLALFQHDFANTTLSLVRPTLHALVGAAAGGFASYLALNVLEDAFDLDTLFGVFSQGFLAGFVGLVAWFTLLSLLRSPELIEALASVRARFWRTKALAPEEVEPTV